MNIGEILSFFVLFGVVLSILFGGYWHEKIAYKHKLDSALWWFLFFVLLHVLYIIFSRYILLNDLFIGEAALFNLLYMPFYWHAVCLSQNKPTKVRNVVLSFIPAVLFWTFFFVLKSNQEWTILYYTAFKQALYVFFAFLLMSYGVWGFAILFKKGNNIEDLRFKQLIAISSLIMIVVSILYFINFFENINQHTIVVLNINFFVHLLILVLVLSINRMWFYRYIDEKESRDEKKHLDDQLDKYHKSRIGDSELEKTIIDLDEMEIEVYLDLDLNLEKLSTHLRISKYELSQVFSIGLQTSFAKYVNKKRCEYASQLLLNRRETNDSIESIAYESGFNSNTTFYRAFKENYGVPPSRYN
ncbi:helix-turn-helix transcriptional regulator [Myroides guanonis]|uniref:Helix-turn-helix domain-containing protein n=1 Tax=Myroides guanonis TaxID=1150112 RepID=A0A1I3L5B6_9FLAO|nr:helix-turn-helix domain-containing protein [Myroides guanonis]SFI79927.1 Helix-turn-helix domain-containing protein [Myroides guanonis]